MSRDCTIPNKTTEHKAKAILEAHPGKPIQAFYTALMSGSDDAADVAVAIALDPLCGINRKSERGEGALTSGSQNNWNQGGMTPIVLAARNNNIVVAEKLLELGADPNAVVELFKFTSLHEAQSAEMAALLLSYNADPLVVDRHGNSPLHSACLSKRSEIIPLLVANGCDVNAKNEEGFAPMHIAASSGFMPVLCALIAANADDHVLDKCDRTPLLLAVLYNQVEAASYLASLPGTPLNVIGRDGWAPLHLACITSHHTLIRMLLDKNAVVEVESRDTRRPLHVALCGSDKETVNIVLEYGCTVSCELRATPLHVAAMQGTVEFVATLLDNGSGINAITGEGGMSPLHYAAKFPVDVNKCQAVMSLLVAEGANLEVTDAAGWTPLHHAAEQYSDLCLNHLISLGANVNAINKEGQTPLHIAAQKMSVNKIDTLAQMHECNVHIRDKNGQSALDVFELAVHPHAFYGTSGATAVPPLSDVVDRIRRVLATREPRGRESQCVSS